MLGAVGLVVLLHLAVVLVVAGELPSARGLGQVVGRVVPVGLLASLGVWLVARRRRWSFPVLLLVTLGVYVVLQLPIAAASG